MRDNALKINVICSRGITINRTSVIDETVGIIHLHIS